MRALVLREQRAQATVEMAVAAPVLIVLALIVYNIMVFLSATACFDRVAPDAVIAHGVSPSGESGINGVSASCDAVAQQLEQALIGYNIEVEVSSSGGLVGGDDGVQLSLIGQSRTYRCVMRYTPWPSGLSIAGVSMGAPAVLEHTREVTIDPWRPGVVI